MIVEVETEKQVCVPKSCTVLEFPLTEERQKYHPSPVIVHGPELQHVLFFRRAFASRRCTGTQTVQIPRLLRTNPLHGHTQYGIVAD